MRNAIRTVFQSICQSRMWVNGYLISALLALISLSALGASGALISSSALSASGTLSSLSAKSVSGISGTALAPQSTSSQRFIVSFDKAYDVPSSFFTRKLKSLSPHWLRRTSGNGYVLQLTGSNSQINGAIQALHAHPQVIAVENDAKVTPTQASKQENLDEQIVNDALLNGLTLPDDPLFIDQWHLHDDVRQAASIDAVNAWSITQGSAETIIAVIDTGIRPEHPDLVGRLLPGYDFVSGLDELAPSNVSISSQFVYARSNDGDGRDPDPTDPGDGVDVITAAQLSALDIACAPTESTWHGTGVASLIAANANDATGLAGIDWNAMILPIRAIGRCGGHRSDLLDAIRWAAGVEDPALPPNPTPAHIINLSLGMNDICSVLDQTAINDAVAAGAIVVSAVGNQGRNTAEHPSSPAQCDNVIGVAATDEEGYLAGYSNFGRDADIAAPGGLRFPSQYGVTVATNGGRIMVGNAQTYKTVSGTSVAAPLVSGTLSLMRSVQPELTGRELTQLLLDSATPFPNDSENQFIQPCDTTLCGAGLLNAHHAVRTAVAYIPTRDESSELVLNDDSFALGSDDDVLVGGTGLGCSVLTPDAYSLMLNKRGQDPSLLVLLLVALLVAFKNRLNWSGFKKPLHFSGCP